MKRPRRALAGLVTSALLLALAGPAWAVGFQHRMVDDPNNPPIEVGVWYPSDAPPVADKRELIEQTVAPDAPIKGESLPLVLISHGTGGSYTGHHDTALALAEAGFVVVAPTHTGDNWRDHSRVTDIIERPRQMRVVLDDMLQRWPHRAHIDQARVGAFGFSAGGFTVLVLAGGVPDLSRMGPHCAAHPDEFACRLATSHGARLSEARALPADAWTHDGRIRALVVAAPALGYAFAPGGLGAVTMPVQLWRAEEDTVLPQPFFAQVVRDTLPTPPDYHVVHDAEHFAFLAPCGDALARAVPDICADPPGFDRTAFHATFNGEVGRFFAAHLPPAAQPIVASPPKPGQLP